ncbi:MAG: RHS repeat protein [Acidobacteria bacterium]|nr:RHS repeat protein [Acidobacteriota bacterium]MBI3487428.1 RHS repeat protein [Acidobacteriota bacterium]
MHWFLIRAFFFAFLSCALVTAQSYQTSFSEVKFDRAKAPATWHGGFEVEAPTGAVNISLPLGPGIGARGAVFQPKATVRWSPQASAYSSYGPDPTTGANVWMGDFVTPAIPEASLFPGYLDLLLYSGGTKGRRINTRFEILNGPSGTIRGLLPQDAVAGTPAIDVPGLLAAFGLDAGLEVAPAAYVTSPVPAPGGLFVQMTTTDGILIGLKSAAKPLLELVSGTCKVQTVSTFPQVLLLVQGDVAYEFAYSGPMEIVGSCLGTNGDATPATLRDAHFVLKAIRNRFQESVQFTYAQGITATFLTAGNAGTAPSVTLTPQSNGSIKVAYASSASANPSYTIQPTPAWSVEVPGAADPDPETIDAWIERPWRTLGYKSITQDQTGEKITFTYAAGDNGMIVLSRLAFPTRRVDFSWTSYSYVGVNDDTQSYSQGIPLKRFMMGVTSLSEQALANDTNEGAARVTTFDRTLPVRTTDSNYPLRWSADNTYASTDFYVAIQKGGGPVQLIRLAPALPGQLTLTGEDPAQANGWSAIQRLMHVKHLVVEERTYEPDVRWQSDLAAPCESSTAYYRMRHPVASTAWSLRRPGNPAGLLLSSALPYPLITETWEAVGKTGASVTRHTTSTIGDGTNTLPSWSNTAFTWTSNTVTTELADHSESVTRTTTSSFDPKPALWLLPRKTQDATVVTQDTTAGAATGCTYPFALPVQGRTLASASNTPLTVYAGDVTATFTYGSTAPATALAQSVKLESPGAIQSGKAGASYQYDGLGNLTSIQKSGMDWTVQQSLDGLGRPASQTDPNGFTTSFGYDAAGRLTSSSPANSEEATTIAYDDTNHRVVTVTRGAGTSQKTKFTYNGFGELIREQRSDGTTWSNKLHAYDTQGRHTAESIWLPEAQVTESGWSSPAFTPALSYQYDARGRVTALTNANGEKTTTDYSNLAKVVSTFPTDAQTLTTTYASDIQGRLVQVTDAKSQITRYRYDPAGRIAQVVQTDPGTLASQTRTWTYDAMGKLTALVQPESGRTEYQDFTVLGKPATVRYGVVGTTPKVTLSYAFDTIGRVTGLSSSDASVSQTFTYDNVDGGNKAKGRMSSATADGVVRKFEYLGLNGRLSKLTTEMDGQRFEQTLTYDTYGNLTGRTYPHRTLSGATGIAQGSTQDIPRGLPSGESYNGNSLATLTYDAITWALTQISQTSAAASQFFFYRSDQVGLARTVQSVQSQTVADWKYAYDGAGRLSSDGVDYYSYDELGRLNKAYVRDPFDASSGQGPTGILQKFTYDAFGNRIGLDSKTVTNWTAAAAPPAPGAEATTPTSKAQSYSFSASDPALSGKNQLPAGSGVGTGALYDDLGNLTRLYKAIGDSSQALSLTYDALGRVKTMTDSARNAAEVYTYDDQGLRVLVEVYQGSITPPNLQKKQYRIYNEARQLVSEFELVLE